MCIVCSHACRHCLACRCGRARCCCGPCISPPHVSSVAMCVAPGPTVQSCDRKKIKLVKKRKRKNKNMPKSLFHCVCCRYWRSRIVSTKALARAAGSGFVFPWAGPKPLVGRHEGPAGLGPNRLGPAQLMALSQACTSLLQDGNGVVLVADFGLNGYQKVSESIVSHEDDLLLGPSWVGVVRIALIFSRK